MVRIHPNSSLSDSPKSKLEDDTQTPTMDSTIRDGRISLQILQTCDARADPMSWTQGSTANAESAEETEQEKTTQKEMQIQDNKSGIDSEKTQRSSIYFQKNQSQISYETYKSEESLINNNNLSPQSKHRGSIASYLSGSRSNNNSPRRSLNQGSYNNTNNSNQYSHMGMADTDIDDGDRSGSSDNDLSSGQSPREKRYSAPRLSIISENKGVTAWLQTAMLFDNSSTLSAFVEDPNLPPENYEADIMDNGDTHGNSVNDGINNSTFDLEAQKMQNILQSSSDESGGQASHKNSPKHNKSNRGSISTHKSNSSKSQNNHFPVYPANKKLDMTFADTTIDRKKRELGLHENMIMDKRKTLEDNIEIAYNINSCISSGVYNEYTESSDESEVPYELTFKKPTQSSKRDFSKNSKLRFPSKSGGYWVPRLKPLAEFLDYKFEGKKYEFTDEEMEFIKKIDFLLSCNFCYRGFNILMMMSMILNLSAIIVVTTLFALEKLPIVIELIHILFFDLVALFILFTLNSCASREVRINGEYAVISYVRIYWHLMKRSISSKYREKYLFIDDWFGDDKSKFIKKNLKALSELNLELENNSEFDLDNQSNYI